MPEIEREDDADTKRQKYLILVKSGIEAIYFGAFSAPDLDAETKASLLNQYVLALSTAIGAADRIPAEATAISAALDILNYSFGERFSPESDPDREWLLDLSPGRTNRLAWAGLGPRSATLKWLARQRLWKKLKRRVIDGKLKREKLEWHGLQFDDSFTLNLLSWVRSEGKIYLRDLARQLELDEVGPIHARMEKLAKADWLIIDYEPNGAITYERTSKLRDTGENDTLKPRLPKPAFASPSERYTARRRQKQAAAMDNIHRKPEARKILTAIKKRGALPLRSLRPLTPHMTRLGLRHLMQRLRAAGWVECVGEGGGAAWRGTRKLLGEDG